MGCCMAWILTSKLQFDNVINDFHSIYALINILCKLSAVNLVPPTPAAASAISPILRNLFHTAIPTRVGLSKGWYWLELQVHCLVECLIDSSYFILRYDEKMTQIYSEEPHIKSNRVENRFQCWLNIIMPLPGVTTFLWFYRTWLIIYIGYN